MTPPSTSKRIKRWVTLILVILVVGGGAELVRRDWDREHEAKIRRALVHARSTGGSPAEVEPDWNDLAESLRSRIRSDPTGSLAKLAARAEARVSLKVPRAFSLVEQPTIPVVYGDRPADEIPVPDRPYLWIADVEGSWDRGPWRKLGQGSWGPDGPFHGELDISAAAPDDRPVSGWATLNLRLMLKLYVGENVIEAVGASSPEELARVPAEHRESRSLGGYRVKVLDREAAPEAN